MDSWPHLQTKQQLVIPYRLVEVSDGLTASEAAEPRMYGTKQAQAMAMLARGQNKSGS